MEIRFVDWFAGIGGFRLGLEKANKAQEVGLYGRQDMHQCRPDPDELCEHWGETPSGHIPQESYRCVGACEINKYARQVYARNFGHEPEWADSRTVDPASLPDFDLFCAGFPCQSFSVAGQRRGFRDSRGTLFFEIVRICGKRRPSYILLENVKGLLSVDKGFAFEAILSELSNIGYDLQWEVLNSKNFGVPQNRERVFIVGHLRGLPRPQVFPLGQADGIYSKADRTESTTAIDSNYHKGWLYHGQRTMVLQAGHRTKGRPRFYEDEIPAMTQDYGTGGQNVPLVAMTERRTEDAKVIRCEAQKDGKDWCPRRGKELMPRDDGMANAVTSGQSKEQLLGVGLDCGKEVANALDHTGYLYDTHHINEQTMSGRALRRLTPLECERLQGFPDGWTEGISDTQRYRCLGNAVTVNVVQAIGERLLEELT